MALIPVIFAVAFRANPPHGGGPGFFDLTASIDIPEDFLAKLFGLAVPEDLARYNADELAGVAEKSWAFLAGREVGLPKIRFESIAAPAYKPIRYPEDRQYCGAVHGIV